MAGPLGWCWIDLILGFFWSGAQLSAAPVMHSVLHHHRFHVQLHNSMLASPGGECNHPGTIPHESITGSATH